MADVRFTRSIDKDLLARLKAAREEADAAYNAALSALDAALPAVPAMPHPSAPADESQITPLNERFAIVGATPLPGGLKGWLLRPVWGLVAPLFARQEAFNATLVDHVNRNVAAARSGRGSQIALIETLRLELERLATFHSALIIYLQQVTPYVDSKDYEFDALSTRRTEDVGQAVETLHHRTVGPGGAISGVGDELNRRLEMLAVREHRYTARVAALDAAHAQLAQSLGVVTRATQTLKREVEGIIGGRDASPRRPSSEDAAAGDGRLGEPALPTERALAATTAGESFATGGIESFKYVGFEDQFRGSTTVIRERLQDYVAVFDGQQDVLDIGCGRGEFLDLLRQQGIRARGLDINHEMVEVCRQRGLDASEGDALSYLQGLEDESLGGIFAAQVVEHLQPDYLVRLLQRAGEVLRPGGVLALETVNVACWFAFFQSYVRDITHVRPLHPDTLAYFVRASGFPHVDVQYRSPYPEVHKLQHVPGADAAAYAMNANVDTLNSLLFTHLDYAVIARKP
ncbi:bifunctional 2-polyprenyl-6-hydroxyphenol methylase/3-demethylubiquinol 3-O-methyltransferase UbiG [Luteitalea sp.]|uniref:class I SAM-dependent methyltransferase n=1 Tax=Luteitalea sp. TaxID=2004800 RepID=UPI0025C60E11|nr:class I SAM-dependent methyltransferase [Luteitalea sp.]